MKITTPEERKYVTPTLTPSESYNVTVRLRSGQTIVIEGGEFHRDDWSVRFTNEEKTIVINTSLIESMEMTKVGCPNGKD